MPLHRLSVDVGGTFTDFVLLDEDTGQVKYDKVPSLHARLESSFLEGIDRLGVELRHIAAIAHGTTVVINAILQKEGAPIALITTEGFQDVIELGRGNRPDIYDVFYQPPPPAVPRDLRFEVSERVNSRGEVLTPLDEEGVRKIGERLRNGGIEAVAVCFLHSYSSPAHELRAAEILKATYPGLHVSLSHQIVGEWREYERFSTTALNAYVMPVMSTYLSRLEQKLEKRGFQGVLGIMQSTGGVMSSEVAKGVPIRTLESGPAGGVMGAVGLGELMGYPNIICGDVGGTSFDVALIVDGAPFESTETSVDRYPVLAPTIDVVSIGAGGGSIAWIHRDGSLRVGPQSAEADPGPACFAMGGTEPTVTDAHVCLGRINPDYFLAERMKLDVGIAKETIGERVAMPLGLSTIEASHGITRIADMNMTYAIRNLTIERGYDPRDFVLMCYGGAGGLFAASLARELDIPTVVIPPEPANFSAWGILGTDYRADAVKTSVVSLVDTTGREERASWTQAATEEIASVSQLMARFAELEGSASQILSDNSPSVSGLRVTRSLDMRYEGQEHTVRVALPSEELLRAGGLGAVKASFDQAHHTYYEHSSPESPAEIVTLRVSVAGVTSKPKVNPIAEGSGRPEEAMKTYREVYFQELGDFAHCPTYDRSKLGAGDEVEGPAVVEEWASTSVVRPGQQLRVGPYGELIISRL
jgi:N-methylhydantoinase A